MAGFSSNRAADRAPASAPADSGVQLAQAQIGLSRNDFRESGLQEARAISGGTPLSPGITSSSTFAFAAFTVVSNHRIAHLQNQMENVLSGAPATRENILANPQARKIQLEILDITGSTSSLIGKDSRTVGSGAGAMFSGTSAGNRAFAVELLTADLRQALGKNAPTPENILANPEARKIHLKILDHIAEIGHGLTGSPTATGAPAGIKGASNHHSVKDRISTFGGAQAHAISAQRIEIYQADLRDALNGAVATPENILASADARRAQRLIIGEASKMSAFAGIAPGGTRGGIASADGASGGSADSQPGRSRFGSAMVSGTMTEMSVSLLSEDVKRALNGSASSPQSLLDNREAREAQFQILAIRANHVNSAELALKGGGRSGGGSGAVGAGHLMARSHLTQQMMTICNAELHDALSGKDATPEAIAQSPRAYAAFQRLQYLSTGNMTALEATLNQE